MKRIRDFITFFILLAVFSVCLSGCTMEIVTVDVLNASSVTVEVKRYDDIRTLESGESTRFEVKQVVDMDMPIHVELYYRKLGEESWKYETFNSISNNFTIYD